MQKTRPDIEKNQASIVKGPAAWYVYLIAGTAAVGGLLFGFDTAVIAGAIGFIRDQFHLNAAQEGFAVGSVLIGCTLGASIAGAISDRLGRKKVLISAALLFVATAVMVAVSRNVADFALARAFMGIAIGVESVLSPLYIAEVSPAKIRGSLVTMNQVAVVTGILLAYIVDWRLAGLDPSVNWRWMFASAAIPALIFLLALVRVPESPRWLLKQGRSEQALYILSSISGKQQAEREMGEIAQAVDREQSSIRQLLNPGLRVALVIAIVLAIMQQITGINAILYYTPEVFKKAGYAGNDALVVSIFVGAINWITSVFALYVIDKLGRRPLLIGGVLGMAVSLGMVGWSFYSSQFPPICTAVFVLVYVLFFAVGLGPGYWLILSEIFPTRIRGRAMSIATFFIWSSCYVVAQTFPMLVKKVGEPSTFWLYALMSIIALVFIWRLVPETKGKTLEEIESMWSPKGETR